MKKLMIMGMCSLAMLLVGCSKASKYESIEREAQTILMGKVDEDAVKKEVEKFKKLSAEEQDKLLEKAEKALKELKEMEKAK
jgi:hypothetical protein